MISYRRLVNFKVCSFMMTSLRSKCVIMRTPLMRGSGIMQELCFQVTRDAFLCHALSGFSTVLVSPNRFYT